MKSKREGWSLSDYVLDIGLCSRVVWSKGIESISPRQLVHFFVNKQPAISIAPVGACGPRERSSNYGIMLACCVLRAGGRCNCQLSPFGTALFIFALHCYLYYIAKEINLLCRV